MSATGWLVAAGLMVAVGLGMVIGNRNEAPVTPAAPPAVPPTSPAPMAMPKMPNMAVPPGARPQVPLTPRDEADMAFNEAMSANEQGDQATARRVIPMALAAYLKLGELDDDSTYHVALLQLVGGDFVAARATSEKILAKKPSHLLALSVAARAAAGAGDAKGAQGYNERLLAGYDTEIVKPLPEYQDHQRVLPIDRAAAQKALGR